MTKGECYRLLSEVVSDDRLGVKGRLLPITYLTSKQARSSPRSKNYEAVFNASLHFLCREESKMADSELASKLNRQQQRNDGEIAPSKVTQSVYSEFKEFSIPEIKEFRKTFQK